MNKKSIIVLLTVFLMAIFSSACGSSSAQNDDVDNKDKIADKENNSDGETNKSFKDTDENKMENFSEDTDDTQINDQENTSEDTSTNSNNEKSSTSRNGDGEVFENNKEKYLKKLNEMEESDKNTETKTTISDMEEQEEERYKNWDKTLNEIYGVLKEQLSTEQMKKLKEEQRNWVKYKDETAKEASLEYEGGSTESLEYVATQASLTKERCYKLVANYMR